MQTDGPPAFGAHGSLSPHGPTAAALFDAAVPSVPGVPGAPGIPAVRRLAVIGLAKNVGKTVTLGALAAEAAARGLTLGLCSTGRDGERKDAVTELPKPAILAPQGALVTTTEDALKEGGAAIETLERLPFTTPFGQALVGRVTRAGTVLLIGPGTASRLRQALEVMDGHGASLCLVDGSLDRLAAAAPGVTEAAVVATGAALGATPVDVARQTALALDVLRLPGLEPGRLRDRASEAMDQGAVTLLEGEDLVPRHLGLATAAGAWGDILAALRPDTRAVVLGGALPAGLLRAAGTEPGLAQRLRFIVRDATRVFPEPLDWRRFRRRGGTVEVLQALRVPAVTCNPWSPTGPSLPAEELWREVARVAAPAPAFDLVAGLGPH